MANRVAYQALKAEARRVGFPEYYRADLTTHDRNALSRRDAPAQFGWVLRRCGTHLWPPTAEAAELVQAILHMDRQKGGEDEPHFYWYDGRQLVAVTPPQLVHLLTGAHAQRSTV